MPAAALALTVALAPSNTERQTEGTAGYPPRRPSPPFVLLTDPRASSTPRALSLPRYCRANQCELELSLSGLSRSLARSFSSNLARIPERQRTLPPFGGFPTTRVRLPDLRVISLQCRDTYVHIYRYEFFSPRYSRVTSTLATTRLDRGAGYARAMWLAAARSDWSSRAGAANRGLAYYSPTLSTSAVRFAPLRAAATLTKKRRKKIRSPPGAIATMLRRFANPTLRRMIRFSVDSEPRKNKDLDSRRNIRTSH